MDRSDQGQVRPSPFRDAPFLPRVRDELLNTNRFRTILDAKEAAETWRQQLQHDSSAQRLRQAHTRGVLRPRRNDPIAAEIIGRMIESVQKNRAKRCRLQKKDDCFQSSFLVAAN